jgi:hypothetical protein
MPNNQPINQSINHVDERNVPLTSTDRFFAGVDQLFTLLDIDGDDRLDFSEATLGLTECFDRVHRTPADEPLSHSAKQAAVRTQAHWLFSATHHNISQTGTEPVDANVFITRSEFKACYLQLLESAYEMEVLMLDLQRAIAALTESRDWANVIAICRKAKSVYPIIANDVSKRALCFAALQSASTQISSQRASTQISSIVNNIVKAESLTERDWLYAWKQILVHPFNRSVVLADLEQVASGH